MLLMPKKLPVGGSNFHWIRLQTFAVQREYLCYLLCRSAPIGLLQFFGKLEIKEIFVICLFWRGRESERERDKEKREREKKKIRLRKRQRMSV